MGRYLLFLLPVLFSSLSNAQEIEVKAWFDSTEIFIGDQINFNIETVHPEGSEIKYPAISDTLAENIEILESYGPDTIQTIDNKLIVLQKYLVTCFDTGFYEIPPQFAEISDSDGVSRYFSDYSHLLVSHVNIAPADSTELIFDIAGPRRAGVTLMEVLPWVLLFAVVALVVYYIIRYFGRKTKTVIDEKTLLPSEPIHIIALRDFDKLERKEYWQKGHHKRYYTELTEILRAYIDRRYGIASLEMTTAETLNALLVGGFARGDLYKLLSGLLTTADLSKFAKYRPEDTINTQSLEDARFFIKKTYIRPQVIEKESETDEDEEVNNE